MSMRNLECAYWRVCIGSVLLILGTTPRSIGTEGKPAAARAPNSPPEITITFPDKGPFLILPSDYVRLKASASDRDGSIAQVEFYANCDLVGVVTNSPFTLRWWHVPADVPDITLTAVAIDNLGAATTSAPYELNLLQGSLPQPIPLVRLSSPSDGAMFPAPATLEFRPEGLVRADGGEW